MKSKKTEINGSAWYQVLLLLVVTGLFLPMGLKASPPLQQKITGKVVASSDGMPLPGVTVIDLSSSSNGVVTDFDGNFEIMVSDPDATLQFSFIGFKTQEINISGRSTIDVSMEEDISELDEVVIVGYGEQKKINLTGSVETVKFPEEVNQPVTNSAQLLYGRFSGVQLTQSSGVPGGDGSSVVIRGVGTFGNSTPLLVIDNIQYDNLGPFNNLAPSDIESITVLKDASASAIYGARGANGVIVVTTKKGGEESFQVNYNSYYGYQSATVVPKFLNSYDYAVLINEKFRNQNGENFEPRYTDAQLEAIQTGSNPDQFANTNWAKEVLTDAPILNHNLSFSGGNKKTTYRLSLGYLNQKAIVKSKFETERYNLSFNLNSKIKDWLTISNVLNGFWSKDTGPDGGRGAFDGDNGIIYSFQRTAPTIPVFYSNGEYGIVDGAYENNNFSFLTQNPLRSGFFGNNVNDNINISERLGLTFKFSDKFTFETSGSANLIYGNSSNYRPRATLRDYNGEIVTENLVNALNNSTNFSYRLLNENILRFNDSFNAKHNVGVLLGHSVIYDRTDGFAGSLRGFPTDIIEEFNGGGVLDPAVSGGANEESYQSFFGRINYNYDGKYLVEFNIRRDGSSKFGPGNRYANFPSASVGWNLAKENFLSDSRQINSFKLRASWGITGNDRIGNYIFEQTYNSNLDYVLGNDVNVGGVALTGLSNPTIKWEEVEQYNIGLDASFFGNRLEFVGDYYQRKSSDILYGNFPIPNTLGVTNLAAQNAASMVNRGLELSLNHRNNLGKFRYNLGVNVTKLILNEVTGLGDGGEETIGGNNIIRIGEPLRAYYGYRAIGIFQSFEEVALSPEQFGNTNTAPGDIKYADISGPDGIPDGVVNADDRTVIGNPYPELLYNINGGFEFAGIDMNFLFQGVHNIDRLLEGNGQYPMADDRSNVLEYWINRWTPENPSEFLPRLGGQNNTVTSTFYMRDASYLRLKNIELGYTIPKEVTRKMKIDRLRVFAGGQNILTFTRLDDFDPERAAGAQSNRLTPLYKTITLGINAKF
ncbi:TonB-dependent receptor [Muricauda sp. ANG21]|uniref:SusC/RagA family TonB-linked outer membrane protein n=1 Tax=Allomuricauda sp. ANG21 TaxID=3042468 RepID=UPI0034517CBF